MQKFLYLIYTLLVMGGGLSVSYAKILLTVDDALKNYYPGCKVTEENLFLTDQQLKELEQNLGHQSKTKLFTRRVVDCKGTKSFLYLDSETVRTQAQVLMIVVNAQNILEKVEVLAYNEPEEYIPMKKWYESFVGKGSGNETPHISGATLTNKATVNSVNKILAIHMVWQTKKSNAK
ncbi:MAG: FMN-binding protein [Bacteriovoracaceae bacterium]